MPRSGTWGSVRDSRSGLNAIFESYCQEWCLAIDSSGGLIDVCHFDSIVEFHSSNDLDQIIESP